MSSNIDPAASLLAEITLAQDLSVKALDQKNVPAQAMTAFKAWATSENIPLDSTNISYYAGTYSGGKKIYFLFDFSGDDPDPYQGDLIVQNGNVIGASINVGD
jgi:hypothetical protein